MPFCICGLAEREGLKHLDHREAKYQHWQGLLLPLFFPKGQGLAEQGSVLAESTLVTPLCRGKTLFCLAFLGAPSRVWGVLFGWFCIAFFVLF